MMFRDLSIALVFSLLPLNGALAAEEFAFFHENVLGTSLELRVRSESHDAAVRAEGRVLREIDRLNKVFSGYDASTGKR